MTTVGLYAMIARRHMPPLRHHLGAAGRGVGSHAPSRLHEPGGPVSATPLPWRTWWVPASSPTRCTSWTAASSTDGGGAVVVASPEVARNCRHTPVWVLGTGEAIAHQGAGKRDLIYIAAHQSSPRAFEMAGVTHDDIDMAMVYDSFTITVVETLEGPGDSAKRARAESSSAAVASRSAADCPLTPTAAAFRPTIRGCAASSCSWKPPASFATSSTAPGARFPTAGSPWPTAPAAPWAPATAAAPSSWPATEPWFLRKQEPIHPCKERP